MTAARVVAHPVVPRLLVTAAALLGIGASQIVLGIAVHGFDPGSTDVVAGLVVGFPLASSIVELRLRIPQGVLPEPPAGTVTQRWSLSPLRLLIVVVLASTGSLVFGNAWTALAASFLAMGLADVVAALRIRGWERRHGVVAIEHDDDVFGRVTWGARPPRARPAGD